MENAPLLTVRPLETLDCSIATTFVQPEKSSREFFVMAVRAQLHGSRSAFFGVAEIIVVHVG